MVRSDQSLSRVRLFATPWIEARQASLSITNSQSSPKLMCIESVMPSSHLIFCHPLLLLPPIPPSIRVFSNESTLRMRWPKYWSFSFKCIVAIVLWAWRNGIWTSDTGFESHWKRESLLLVPWIPFLNTLFSEKLYIKISTSSPSLLCKNWPTIKLFLLNLLDWKSRLLFPGNIHLFT